MNTVLEERVQSFGSLYELGAELSVKMFDGKIFILPQWFQRARNNS